MFPGTIVGGVESFVPGKRPLNAQSLMTCWESLEDMDVEREAVVGGLACKVLEGSQDPIRDVCGMF